MSWIPKKTKRCNIIPIGDVHDQSIQNFLETTSYPHYQITRVAGGFHVVGCEFVKEVEDGKSDKEAGAASEEKPQETATTEKSAKPSRGKDGRKERTRRRGKSSK